MARLLIRGGTLVDGSGGPPRRADLLVEDERIAEILRPGALATWSEALIDASGLVVAPGFIDIHSHGDLIFALPPDSQRPLLEGRIRQGITTEIVGNCGLGVFPWSASSEPALRAVAGWMTPPEAVEWPWGLWRDLESYLSHVESGGVLINVGALQPHGPLRMEVAGLSRRLPGADAATAMRRMSRRLGEALDAGAFGLSTGLIYPPGIYTTTEEIVDLAKALARAGSDTTLLASHIRGSSETLLPAVEELLAVGREAGVRVHHSHSEAVGRGHWHKIERVLAMEESARASGVSVSFDMFPYTAAATMMFAIYPPWAREGGVGRLLERLADPDRREAIGHAIAAVKPEWPPWTEDGWPHNLVGAVGWESITIGSAGSEAGKRLEGMSLARLGRERGRSPFDAVSDLMIEERGMVSQIIHGISGDETHEEGLETLLKDPSGSVCTDASDFGKGKPHPAAYGTYPRVLGRYVRERGALTLEQAVHKMTGQPASLLGFENRGILTPGAFADLVVFDPARVGSEATFEEPRKTASGIHWVLMNGSVVLSDGRSGSSSPPVEREPAGRVLRRRAR